MSALAAPSIVVVFGSVVPAQSDVVDLLVHLGCSKEVSSYSVKLHNHDGKFSPNGTYPISVGMDGSISLGRAPNCPLLITLRVEDVNYESTPYESYVTVSGRCWGEKLFRYTVTKNYLAQKGEAIVKNLMDYYAGITHTRGGVEKVENTDTTYADLDYTDSPAWDILKYVAETADKSGAIGFDFRIAPDGIFEFFPKLSKTNSTVINDNIDVSTRYRKNITRVRNKIRIYGLADKSDPVNKVDWTRSLTPTDGVWVAGAGSVSLDATGAPDGSPCVKLTSGSNYWGEVIFTLGGTKAVNTNYYPLIDFQAKLQTGTYSGTGLLELWDSSSRVAQKNMTVAADGTFRVSEVGVGAAYANQWDYIEAGFDWTLVKVVRIRFYFSNVGSGSFWIHGLYFGGARYSAIEEDAASQVSYGVREYVETDEELWTDNECTLRAKALLAYLKDPAVYLTLTSTLLDYGSSPILGGDKVTVTLPTEGVTNGVFRVDSAEYKVPEGDLDKLEISLELEKTAPMVADYLYGLRTFTVNVEKLARTKVGRRGLPVATGGGAGSGSYFTSDVDINKTSPVLNLLTSRSPKTALGFDGANTFLVTYVGDLILISSTSHLIRPNTDGSDSLGNASFRFDHGYFKSGIHVAGVDTIDSNGRLNINAMPRDAAGLIIEAQGAGFYPMYVNPNGRYVPATHTHQSIVQSTHHVEIDATHAVLNFYAGTSLDGAVGHDGSNYFVVAYTGDLILRAASGLIRPNSSASDDLGSGTFPFGNIYINGVGSFGWVNVAGFTVINSSRQLVNTSVSAASIDRDGVTADVAVAKVGGGTRTLHFVNSRYTGYADS